MFTGTHKPDMRSIQIVVGRARAELSGASCPWRSVAPTAASATAPA
jgi:hypothetical protein